MSLSRKINLVTWI